jgi:N-acetylneuraminic acid mutarotase
MHTYHIQNAEWKQIETNSDHRPPPCYGHSAVVYNDIMNVFGGYDNGGFSSNTLYRFDLRSKQWLESTQLQTISERFHHAVCIDRESGHMYIAGGCNSARTVFDDVYQVDLTNDQFPCTALAPMPNARYGHVMFYNEKEQSLNMFGGCDFKGPEDYFDGYSLQLNDNKWEWSAAKHFKEGSVFATAEYDPHKGVFFFGGTKRNEPKEIPTEEPVIKQVSKEEQSVIELSEQLGDAAMVIIAFLPFHDVLNLILVSKHWHLSMLASRKYQY